MSGTDSVLVVLDDSAQDAATLDWATDEAAVLGGGLTVAYLGVCPPRPDPAATQPAGGEPVPALPAAVDAAVGRAAQRAPWVPVTAWGIARDPLRPLLRLAQDSGRVVLGEGRTGRMFRSLAAQVAVRACRPTVVVRGRPGAAGPVIAHVSGAGSDQLVLRDAFEYARRRRLPLRALHFYRTAYIDPTGQVPPYSSRAEGTELVEAAVAPWTRTYPGVLVECVALAGPAPDRLLEVSAGSGLLVVGGRADGLPAALGDSTVRILAHRARCPVAVAR